MGFLGKLLETTFGVVVTPIAIVKDIVVDGDVTLDITEKVVKSTIKSAKDSVSNLLKGDLL